MFFGKKAEARLKKMFLCLSIFILVGHVCAGCGGSEFGTITQPEEKMVEQAKP